MGSSAFEAYAEAAPAPSMRALAKIALARQMTQTSLAKAVGRGLDASNVRRHFESHRPQENTITLYIEALSRNETEQKLIREYLDVLEGRFDVQAARRAIIDVLCAHETDLREGALAQMLAGINAIDDAELLPALKAFLQANIELRLSLISYLPIEYSAVGRRFGLGFALFADEIRGYIDVERLMDERPPGLEHLWLLWAHMRGPDSPYTDEDRDAIIATAAGRLLRHGFDVVPMLQHLDRLRAHNAKQEALLRRRAGLPIKSAKKLSEREKR